MLQMHRPHFPWIGLVLGVLVIFGLLVWYRNTVLTAVTVPSLVSQTAQVTQPAGLGSSLYDQAQPTPAQAIPESTNALGDAYQNPFAQ